MNIVKNIKLSIGNCLLIIACCCLTSFNSFGQDSTTMNVKGTFQGSLIIDNQTCMVPAAKTFEFSIQHRFGTINNGYTYLYGLFQSANVRFGFNYVALNNLQLGIGIT